MSLRDWLADGHLKAHRTSAEEIVRILRLVDRDLADAEVTAVPRTRPRSNWRPSLFWPAGTAPPVPGTTG